ncbi:hypothetical protein [Herminiimonas aquatilis]|uniref:Transposase n=1 Tax=Herminiimonas aquatilis TaxID=345342 RepID=A0ABW2J2K4_9BURK
MPDSYHFSFISLAGIIRVSIEKARVGKGLRSLMHVGYGLLGKRKCAQQLLAERAFF